MTSPNWPKQFRAAASTFDWSALAQLAAEYATHLYAIPKPPDSVGQVLLVLRQSRRYEELELVADAALAHGPDAPAVRRHYALALVEGGHPAVALRLFTGLAADETASRVDRIEARGGIGRCYKEMFLACTEPDRRRRFLSRSLEAYLAAYLEDTDVYTWHGINAVSLLARAARDGIQLPSGSPKAAALADDILRTVDSAPVRDTWTEVTACEAAIALGRYDEAVERGEAFIETTPEMFTVATFLRQLQKVWQLDTTTLPGDDLLPVLRSALLAVDGGRVTVASSDLRATRLADELGGGRLEAILGADRYLSLSWYRTGLKRCRAVARIQTVDDLGVGTGFLVAGPTCTRTYRHSWSSPTVTSSPRTSTPAKRTWRSTASMTIRADRAASGWPGNGGTSLRRTGDSTPRSSNWTAIHRTLFPRHLRKGCPPGRSVTGGRT